MMSRAPLRHRPGGGVLLVLGLVAVGGLTTWASVRPSHDRAWSPEHAVLAEIELHDSLVTIRNLRNFRYPGADSVEIGYADRTLSLKRLESVWLVLAPFCTGWRGPAHAFLTFSFADSQFVSVSVESRREVGEQYSVWRGMLRQYELLYVIGDERDLIALRAVRWNDSTYLYPTRATPEQARELFVRLLRRAEQIRRTPEFYNTLTNNCTTNLVAEINSFATRPIRYGRAILLPGYSDELALRMGLLDTDLPLELARERYRINEAALRAHGAEDFSLQIRDSPAMR